MYEVLARALPYECEPSHLVIVGVITCMLDRPSLSPEQAAKWPPQLLGLMGGCMAEDAAARPDIESVLDVLEDVAPKDRAAATRHSGVTGGPGGAPAYAAAQASRDGTPRGNPALHASPSLHPSRAPVEELADPRPPPLAYLRLGSPAGRSSRHVAMGDDSSVFSPVGSAHGMLFCKSDPGQRRAVPTQGATSPRARPGSPRAHVGNCTARMGEQPFGSGGRSTPSARPPPRPPPAAATPDDLEDAALDRAFSISQRQISLCARGGSISRSISRQTPAAARTRSISRAGTGSRVLGSVTAPAQHAGWRVEDDDAMRYSHGDEEGHPIHDSVPASPTSSADGDASLAALAVTGFGSSALSSAGFASAMSSARASAAFSSMYIGVPQALLIRVPSVERTRDGRLVFVIEASLDGVSWTVRRHERDAAELHTDLKRTLRFLPPPPLTKTRWPRAKSADATSALALKLEEYLQALAGNGQWLTPDAAVLRQFLQVPITQEQLKTKSILMGLEMEHPSLLSPNSCSPPRRAHTSREQARHPPRTDELDASGTLPLHPRDTSAAAGGADRRAQSFQVGRAASKNETTRRV